MKKLRRTPIRWDKERGQYVVTYWIPAESDLPSNERRHRRFAKTQQEAEKLYDELKAEYSHFAESKPACDPDVTLRKYVDDWLQRVQKDYEAKSYRSLKVNLENHVKPSLGKLKVRDVRAGTVLRMLESIQRKGFTRDGKQQPYSDDAIRLIRSALSVVLSDAILDGIITANPCSGLLQGRRTRAGRRAAKADGRRQKRIRPFSATERALFLKSIRGEWLGPLWETMLRCGLRPGESYALTPRDVDLTNKVIRVDKSLAEDGRIKTTKTKKTREVMLATYPELLALLQEYVPWLRDTAKRQQWHACPLFPSIEGTYLDNSNVRRELKHLLERTEGLPQDKTPYDLRHTFATHSLQVEREEIGFVSKQLGHEKVTTTWDWYYDWLPDNLQAKHDGESGDDGSEPPSVPGATVGATEPRSDNDQSPEVTESTWSRRADLNRRPADYESAALPLSYTGSRRDKRQKD